jgi:glyoxylate reductase
MNYAKVQRATVRGVSAPPRVVVAVTLPAVGLDLLQARVAVEAGDGAGGHLREQAAGAAAIVTEPSIQVSAELLDAAAESRQVAANFGVGHDNIDLEPRVPGGAGHEHADVLTDPTAELAVALMLAAGRRVAHGDALVLRGQWTGHAPFLGRELVGAPSG